MVRPACARTFSKADLAYKVSGKVRSLMRWTLKKSLTWSKKMLHPQSLWLVRNPDIWGIRPGCAEIIWSTEIPSLGFSCSFLQIEPLFLPLLLHGLWCAWTNWQATHRGILFLHSSRCFGRYPFLAIMSIFWNGILYHLWFQLISSCFSGESGRRWGRFCASLRVNLVPT